MIKIRKLPGSPYYAVSDGKDELTICPCCDQPFTRDKANKVKARLEAKFYGISTIAQLVAVAARGGPDA